MLKCRCKSVGLKLILLNFFSSHEIENTSDPKQSLRLQRLYNFNYVRIPAGCRARNYTLNAPLHNHGPNSILINGNSISLCNMSRELSAFCMMILISRPNWSRSDSINIFFVLFINQQWVKLCIKPQRL